MSSLEEGFQTGKLYELKDLPKIRQGTINMFDMLLIYPQRHTGQRYEPPSTNLIVQKLNLGETYMFIKGLVYSQSDDYNHGILVYSFLIRDEIFYVEKFCSQFRTSGSYDSGTKIDIFELFTKVQ